MNAFTNPKSDGPNSIELDPSYLEVQDAIDEIYDLRSKVVRIGLLGTLLYRPDPMRPTPDAERDSLLALLKEQVSAFDAATRLMERGAPFPDISPSMCSWICKCAQECPKELALASRVNKLGQRVLVETLAASDRRSAALAEHMKVARAGYHDAISVLCEHMWATYEVPRNGQLERAKTAARTLDTRLTRLERIGTHVRLVSLNASVEASRVGEAGRGLSIIAHEFKELAEEVGRIAQAAREDVTAMQIHN